MPKKATKMFDGAVQIGNSLYLAYGFQDYDHITDDELRQFTYGNCMNGTIDVRYWWDDDETMTIVGSLGHKSIYLHEYWQPGEMEHVGSEETVAAAAVEMGAEAILKNRGVTASKKAPKKLSGKDADAMRLKMRRMSKRASRTVRRIPKSAGIDLRTLPVEELKKRAIRDNMKAENDAIMMYSMYVSLLPAGDPVRKGLEDIMREEKLHVGELQRLLESEDPDELMAFEEGKAEVDAQLGVRSASMSKKADSYGYVYITSEGGTLVAEVVVEGLFTKKVDGVEVPDGYGFGDSVDFDRNEAIEYGFEDPDDIDPWDVADFLEDNRERVASVEAEYSYGYIVIDYDKYDADGVGVQLIPSVYISGTPFGVGVDGAEVPDGYEKGDVVYFSTKDANEYGFHDLESIDPRGVTRFLQDNMGKTAKAEKKALRVEGALPPEWDYVDDDTWSVEEDGVELYAEDDVDGFVWYVSKDGELVETGREDTLEEAQREAEEAAFDMFGVRMAADVKQSMIPGDVGFVFADGGHLD